MALGGDLGGDSESIPIEINPDPGQSLWQGAFPQMRLGMVFGQPQVGYIV
jgi:hypothetical protein